VGGHEAPGWLVVSDAYDDGWHATVNGRDARLVRANGVFMAIPLPAGEAEVALTYRPLSFRVGAWISGFSLLFAIIAGLVRFATTRPDRGMDRGSEPVPGT
jgi:uncharacterized membrane protein YfhO